MDNRTITLLKMIIAKSYKRYSRTKFGCHLMLFLLVHTAVETKFCLQNGFLVSGKCLLRSKFLWDDARASQRNLWRKLLSSTGFLVIEEPATDNIDSTLFKENPWGTVKNLCVDNDLERHWFAKTIGAACIYENMFKYGASFHINWSSHGSLLALNTMGEPAVGHGPWPHRYRRD